MTTDRVSTESAEELEAKGLVPTMWDSMAAAQISNREDEFPAELKTKKATTAAEKTPKKESDT